MNNDTTFILNPDRRSVGGLLADDPVTQVFRKASVTSAVPTIAGKTNPLAKPGRRLPLEERTTVYLGDRKGSSEEEEPTGLWQRPEVDEFEFVETQSYGPDCIHTAEVTQPTLGRRWIGLAFIAAMLVGAGTGALLLPV